MCAAGDSLQATLLVTVKDLVTRLTGNVELICPAKQFVTLCFGSVSVVASRVGVKEKNDRKSRIRACRVSELTEPL